MDDGALPIGRLAGRLGVPVHTVRFWSDEGLVDPPTRSAGGHPRSAGGHRRYDPAAVARPVLAEGHELPVGFFDVDVDVDVPVPDRWPGGDVRYVQLSAAYDRDAAAARARGGRCAATGAARTWTWRPIRPGWRSCSRDRRRGTLVEGSRAPGRGSWVLGHRLVRGTG
ncbi:MerR family DNA-binding transcriptional regulator [Geodermatophilus sp. SYSU D00697]